MDKEQLRKLGNNIMLDFSEEELQLLADDFDVYLKQVELINKIDTDNVEPMVYCLDQETTFLREDVVDHQITQEEALLNSKNKKEGFIEIPKVIG